MRVLNHSKLHVTLFQMNVEFGNSKGNLQKITDFLESHQVKKNSFVILPELFLTGYHKEEIRKTAFEDSSSTMIIRLHELAKQFQIYLYGSIAEKVGNDYCNTAVLVTPDGLKETYRKIHLFGPMGEKELFKQGSQIKTTKINDTVFGLSICYDLRFPMMYQQMMSKNAGVILIVAEWPITRVNHWSALLKARAIENQAYVIGVNRVGDDPDYTYGGHSAIYSPYGDVDCEIPNSEEGFIECEIDLKLIDRFRNQFDVRLDRM